jgi:uncharacterized protein YndB with AHSA1/START domain
MKNEEAQKTQITLQVMVNAPMEKVWKTWTSAVNILQWNSPSDDWHTTQAEIDFREQGKFMFRMEAKEGSAGFDYGGTYDKIVNHKHIEHTGNDGRRAIIKFISDGDTVCISETFDPDKETPIELQKEFCQGVLCNFKKFIKNATTK